MSDALKALGLPNEALPKETPLCLDNDDQKLGPRSKNAVFFREMFGESHELLKRAEDIRREFEEFLEIRHVLIGTQSQPGLLSTTEKIDSQVNLLDEQVKKLFEICRAAEQVSDSLSTFDQRVGATVTRTFSDAFLTEQGQQLVAEVAQRLATDGARESLEKALRVIADELNAGAQKVADGILAEHHVRTVAELRAENLALKKQLEAALDKRFARIEGAMQNIVLAAFGGVALGAIAMYFGSVFI